MQGTAGSQALYDEHDSDGVLDSNMVKTTAITGKPGDNDHSFDFGFVPIEIEIVKLVNTPNTVTVGSPISFTIRITNTGGVTITELTLSDDYNATYLTYDTAADLTGPQSRQRRNPGSDPLVCGQCRDNGHRRGRVRNRR